MSKFLLHYRATIDKRLDDDLFCFTTLKEHLALFPWVDCEICVTHTHTNKKRLSIWASFYEYVWLSVYFYLYISIHVSVCFGMC